MIKDIQKVLKVKNNKLKKINLEDINFNKMQVLEKIFDEVK